MNRALRRFDPGHLLLDLASREVLSRQLEVSRLQATLDDCAARTLELRHPGLLTPLAFPLWAEGMRGHLSSESWRERVQRAARQLEEAHAR